MCASRSAPIYSADSLSEKPPLRYALRATQDAENCILSRPQAVSKGAPDPYSAELLELAERQFGKRLPKQPGQDFDNQLVILTLR